MERLYATLHGLHPDVDFQTAENLIDDGVLDSFDIVTIVSEIDIDYDVIIPPEALTPENFNSAHALYALVRQLMHP